MNQKIKEQLQNLIKTDSSELIEEWIKFFSESQKEVQSRYYDDFLGFFEECVEENLDVQSESAQTMSMFLRLGFARKKNLDNDFGISHTSWKHFSAGGILQSPPPPKELTVSSPTMDKSLLEWTGELLSWRLSGQWTGILRL